MKLENFHPHISTGKDNNSFVGLKVLGNDIHFYYPESYHFDSNCFESEDVLDLLNTISLAKSFSEKHVDTYDATDSGNDSALLSCCWLIRDYLSNDIPIYWNKEFVMNGRGKINWKRTLKQQPYISNNNLVFKTFITECLSPIDVIIVEAYKFCLFNSIRLLGWLFSVDADVIEVVPNSEDKKEEYLYAITAELEKTFNDDKRLRLEHMRNVILGLDVNCNKQNLIYGVDSYHFIFEKMIDSIFGNVDRIRDFYPSAKWHLVKNDNEYYKKNASKLRPDTIILNSDGNDKYNAYILDSKFYRYGYTGEEDDLPETTSIQKQITYGEYIKKNTEYPIANAYSAFLLPYDKSREKFKSNNNLQYIGFAEANWKDNNDSHELIHAFLIDLRYVINEWNRNNHEDVVRNLINLITEKQNEAHNYLNVLLQKEKT